MAKLAIINGSFFYFKNIKDPNDELNFSWDLYGLRGLSFYEIMKSNLYIKIHPTVMKVTLFPEICEVVDELKFSYFMLKHFDRIIKILDLDS